MTGFLDLSTSMTRTTLNPNKLVFVKKFLHFLAIAHISRANCDKMVGDKWRQPAYEVFSIKRRF